MEFVWGTKGSKILLNPTLSAQLDKHLEKCESGHLSTSHQDCKFSLYQPLQYQSGFWTSVHKISLFLLIPVHLRTGRISRILSFRRHITLEKCLINHELCLYILSDVCEPSPCENGGRCYPMPGSKNGYFCYCQPDFQGDECNEEVGSEFSSFQGFIINGD